MPTEPERIFNAITGIDQKIKDQAAEITRLSAALVEAEREKASVLKFSKCATLSSLASSYATAQANWDLTLDRAEEAESRAQALQEDRDRLRRAMKLALPFLRRAAENAGPEHVGPQVAYAAARSALDASRGEQKQGVSSAARSRHSSAQEPTREGGSPLEASATLPPSLAVKPNIPWEKQTVEQLEAERDYWAQQVAAAPGWASANAADGFRRACDSWLTRRRRNPVSSAEPAADRGPGLNPDPVPQ